MATCKKCIHNEMCNNKDDYGSCVYFQDKSRFIELPCNVGDTVYIVRRTVKKCDVDYIGLSADKKCNHINFAEYYSDGKFMKTHSVGFDEIGQYVFLTPEEAEKVLAERNGINACQNDT